MAAVKMPNNKMAQFSNATVIDQTHIINIFHKTNSLENGNDKWLPLKTCWKLS